MSKELHVIGKASRKVGVMQKVSGQTVYAGDISLPRMLYCKILRSIHPYARIKSIDSREAEALPGVMAVMNGKDSPKKFGIMLRRGDDEVLAIDKTRFVGDSVAAVAALDEETAEEALKLIHVDYEVLEPVMSIAEGTVPPNGEPIHDYAELGNIHKRVSLEFGEMEAGFAKADLIQEDIFYYEGNTHLAMEEHATVAHYEADGKLTIWSSTQNPHYLHKAVANVFDMPPSRIRIIAPPTGGGFGGKVDPLNHEMVVSKLSMMTGRPVKITLTREEVFYAHRGRHPVLMKVKTGVKKDGSITAMDFKSFLDGGGYGSLGVATVYYTGALQTVTYNIPNYKFQGARIVTNKPPCGPKRGHGTPQPRFAVEVQLDKIAEKLGINPLDIRLNHLTRPFTKTANHLSITTTGLRECIEAVEKRSNFREQYGNLPLGKGLGLACGSYITGAGFPIYWNEMPHSGVQIQIDRGGGVTVFCGSTDIGQGSDSVLAYIVAEELGVTVDDISIVTADTSLTPVDLGSYSSRVTLMTGNAAIDAARKLRTLLFETAAKEFGVPLESLDARDNVVFCPENENCSISFPDLVVKAESEHGTLGSVGSYAPPPSTLGGKYKGAGVGPTPAYTYSAAVVLVDVDLETAELKVEKIWIAHDVGKAINPLLVQGQVEGSVYMGLGEAMMEEQVFRRGLHKTPSLLDYKSPTFLETPDIETILIETNDPNGPYGAKEAGQGPLLPIMPAVANAVYDAVGVRIDEIPIHPQKIFKAMRDKEKGKEGRYGPKGVPEIPFPDPIRVESQWGQRADQESSR
ncbi:MAG: molybdopterin-dependent oxidoreductase [SAR324 cluster bacterium]|nr:molybdopterin-dependent oxidoreductase [SAR324 cluster bacterium]